ncbi:MAG: dihydrolipoyl dehydrogenase [Candidatus Marinimicrobia bacterium]|jgi:dihydrolipoamide dehydrogenase|nr:dihydrolipoyl dehydrogenase [Candidatus Neomarinimicrobiota bacterium]MBT3634281.1 dihydrolipoyl dehydrogenase [Candidatus Neomarinimicrobiota bacterium]MBT3682920.1 dihydrolipoyl dehydrogenase [Candidatus Neomarinimicrobiota bacterium]MBT3760090.1 dihydrolipoyl dehydrogenase [Candidatus Neomarinimicrobiota bacterium]MBT3896143.1 dihydrolipoyl dehydrogenase [Candidatus Neomarinimicrobiota bacterium]
MNNKITTELVVIGAGPGGYTAAFRAADLGKKVVLVDKSEELGGVCLNRGCIPSKTLLHISKSMNEVAELAGMGVVYQQPEIDYDKVRVWKNKVIKKLNFGIESLTKRRNIQTINGKAAFKSANEIIVELDDGTQIIQFDHCIIATGSRPNWIPSFPKADDDIMDSTTALAFENVPGKMLVIGGGYIGLELGTVYSAFGSQISVVEFMPSLLPDADPDMVKPLFNKLKKQFNEIMLSTKVISLVKSKDGIKVTFEKDSKQFNDTFDKVLISVGRKPNTENIGLSQIGIKLDERGFIIVNDKQQTNIPGIYAIGDLTGDPMLAHKATAEGRIAAEVIAGKPSAFDPVAIPAVIYTDPEIAWAGLTETECKTNNIPYKKAEFPWSASGRALALGIDEGKTKVLGDPDTGRIIGVGIVGTGAGELIAESVLGMEMAADMEDLGLTIHPHPTLSETLSNAAEVFTGSVTDI